MCVDYSQTPPVIDSDFVKDEEYGKIGECPEDEPEMPPPGYTDQDDWSTTCFQMFPCPSGK